MTKTSRRTPARLSAIGCVLGLLALQAQAQTSPWYLGINQRLEYQSNVFQASAGEVSDTISITSLVGGFDLPVGRQQFFGRASLSANRYQSRSALNNNGHAAQLGVNWETVGNLAGTIALDSSESLAEFNPTGLPGVTDNNRTSTTGARATARIGLVTRLTGEVGVSTRKTRYDNALYQSRNLNIDEVFGGVRYRPAGALILGIGVRATRGEYPNFRNPGPGRFTPETFDRDNVDLSAEWPMSGASRLDARVSIGRDRYDTLTAGNYDGVTGSLIWVWQPTGRTSLTTGYTRTSGDQAQVTNIPGLAPYTASINRVSDTLFASADYELTGKIKAKAGLSFSDASNLDLTRQTTGSERLTGATLGLVWEATRAIRAGCDVSYRTRASQAGVAGYDASIFGCFGEFVLR